MSVRNWKNIKLELLLAFLLGGVGCVCVCVCFQGSEYDGNREETSVLGHWRLSTSRAQEYLAVAMTNELPIVFFKDFIYLFSEGGEEREKEREKHLSVASLLAPYWGLGPQPRHVP